MIQIPKQSDRFPCTVLVASLMLLNVARESRAGADDLPKFAVARLGTTYFRHAGAVTSVAFSNSAPFLASTGDDGFVRLWEVPTGKPIWARVLPKVTCIAFSADGKDVLAGGRDSSVHVFEASTGKERFVIRVAGPVHAIATARDDRSIVAVECSDGRVAIMEPSTGQIATTIALRSETRASITLSPDTRRLVSHSVHTDKLELWNARTGRHMDSIPLSKCATRSAVSISPDGRTFAFAGDTGALTIWEIHSRKKRLQIRCEDQIVAIAFSHDGTLLASRSVEHVLRVWDLHNGKEVRSLAVSQAAPVLPNIAFSKGENWIATGGAGHSIMFWNMRRERPETSEGHEGSVTSAVFLPTNREVITASDDRSGRKWEIKNGKCIERFDCGPQMIRIGDAIITANAAPCEIDLKTGKRRHFQSGLKILHSMAGSDDNRNVVAGGIDGTRVWCAKTRKLLCQLTNEKEDGWITSVAFSPDNKTVAAGGVKIKLWDVPSAKEVLRLTLPEKVEVRFLVFSRDGKILASNGPKGTVILWDVATGKERKRLDENVTSIVFSPKGKVIACGGENGVIDIWEIDSVKKLGSLAGHSGSIASLAFSADGTMLVSGSADTTAFIWDIRKLCSDSE